MIGRPSLKHVYGLSDEDVCERWVHDPYFQFLTGEEFFPARPPARALGPEPLAHTARRQTVVLLAESLRVAHEAGALHSQDFKRVAVDVTVQPKTITSKLLHAAIAGAQPSGGQHGVSYGSPISALPRPRQMMAGATPMPSNSSGISGSCASCAAGWAGSSAISAARSKLRLSSITRASPAPPGLAHPLSAAAPAWLEVLLLPLPGRWSASAKARPPRLTSSA